MNYMEFPVPVFFVPPQIRSLVSGQTRLEVQGRTVGELLAAIEKDYPGVQQTLCAGEELKTGLAVAVDGAMSNRGLYQKVSPQSEVHILPATGGG